MKKGFFKFIAIVMVIVMTAVYVPITDSPDLFSIEAAARTYSGELGGKVKWSYDTDSRTITVSGSGNMKDFTSGNNGQGWTNYRVLGMNSTIVKHARTIDIKSGVTNIGNNAFRGITGVTKVNIPASVTSIGADAFRDMTALSSISIPDSVKTIGARAFQDCSALTSVDMKNNLTSIGESAFSKTKLKTVDMPYSVTNIGKNAFSGISGVKIICNYNDTAYKYCTANSVAYELRKPSLKVEITPTSAANQLKIAFYIKDASGFNAGNFSVEYNSDISPLSTNSDVFEDTATGVTSAIVYGANNTLSIASVSKTNIDYSACGAECSYKIAEITFQLAPNTHVAKATFSSSVFMLCDKRYTLDSTFTEFGDHTFVPESDPVAPTCTAYGYTMHICSICSEKREMNIVEATGHSYNEGVVTPPTCTEGGFTTYTCTACADTKTDNFVPATGHSEKEVITAATCITVGTKKSVCDACQKETLLEIYEKDPSNHQGETEVKDSKDPNCSEKGYTGDTYCKDCSAMIQNGTATDPIAHDYVAVVTAPTCTEKGFTTYTCSACKHSYTDSETEATGHSAGEWETVKNAEIGVAGLEVKKCTVCGEKTEEREIPALGNVQLEPKPDSNVIVNIELNITIIVSDTNAADLKNLYENEGVRILDKNGTEMPADQLAGTGCKIQIIGANDEVLAEYPVVVPMDVNGDATITASDARIALRTSAELDTLENEYMLASDVDDNQEITASDARKILRASAGLS